MPEKNKTKHHQTRGKPPGSSARVAMDVRPLSTEIHFWRELIDSLDETRHSRESLERMRQALALAEYRLAQRLTGLPH